MLVSYGCYPGYRKKSSQTRSFDVGPKCSLQTGLRVTARFPQTGLYDCLGPPLQFVSITTGDDSRVIKRDQQRALIANAYHIPPHRDTPTRLPRLTHSALDAKNSAYFVPTPEALPFTNAHYDDWSQRNGYLDGNVCPIVSGSGSCIGLTAEPRRNPRSDSATAVVRFRLMNEFELAMGQSSILRRPRPAQD